jgi:glycosyltransferase involved in cell wall biosynthesis
LNILILDNSIAFTGAVKCALNEADLLSDKHNIIFVLPSRSAVADRVKEKGYKLYTLPLREISRSFTSISLYPLFLLRNFVTLQRIIRKENIDVVQINDFYNLLGIMLKICGYKGMLLTWVRFLPSSIPLQLRSIWTKGAQKYSDKVVAVSDAVLKELPTKDNTIRVYDPAKLVEDSNSISLYESEITRFLFLANYTRGKGQEYAIEAFSNAYQINQNMQLLLAGSDMGLEKNMIFKKELVAMVKHLGLAHAISVSDFVHDVESEIKRADVVLNFSEGESFSMTCLEASFYGRPVIATRCGGPEEIIAHKETGLLVPRKDIMAMTEAMLVLTNNKHLRKTYGQKGKLYVTRKFSNEAFRKAMGEILHDHVN